MNEIETKSTDPLEGKIALQLFCSYSHADEEMWQELQKHLEVLRRTGLIDVWSDRKLEAGDDWAGAIDSHLESAQVVLFLISADFLASNYCMDIEVKRAMERHKSGEALLVPIILRPVDWYGHPLSKFQALPTHAKAITQWANRDEGFLSVATGLRTIIKAFQSKKSPIKSSSISFGTVVEAPTSNSKRWLLATIILLTIMGAIGRAWYSTHSRPAHTPGVSIATLNTHVNSVDKNTYIRIPTGQYVRGCRSQDPSCTADARPLQTITINTSFWMAQTVVTNQDYFNYLKANAPGLSRHQYLSNSYDPVTNVSWQDANDYCQWVGGRLPFEAEWEYAARSGGNGDEPVGWFRNDSGIGTHRVATVPPNRWSLYDTLGNVWEWCLDWYSPSYYSSDPVICPLGPDKGTRRVMRGGSWKEDAGTIFTYTRSSLPPNGQADNVGFRCVVDNPASNF